MKTEIIISDYKIEFEYYAERVDFKIGKIDYDNIVDGWIYSDGSNSVEIDFVDTVTFEELKIIHQLFKLAQSTAGEYFRVQKELLTN